MTAINYPDAPGEVLQGLLNEARKPTPAWEQGLAAIWVLLTFITFPLNELLLYPAAITYLVLFFIYKEQTFPLLAKSWILIPLPFLVLASAFWAPSYTDALRAGAFYVLALIILITICARLSQREIVRAVLLAGFVALIVAAPSIDTFDKGGPYGHKNIFAIRMVVVLLAALAVALDRSYGLVLRLFALFAGSVAFLFGQLADSATALVFSILAIALMVSLRVFWQPITRVRGLPVISLFLLSLIAGVLAIVFFSNPQLNVFQDFLNSVGKDSTLTNRTWIWEAGERIAREKPWLGVGADGFWRLETAAAQTLNELDHKPAGSGLSFHNAYIEIKVHYGYVGFTLFVGMIAWSLWTTFRHWLAGKGMAISFFLVAALIAYSSTFTESYMVGAFDTMSFLFYAAGVSSLAQTYHQGRTLRVRLVENPVSRL
jgi:exopolysaccharide production protein ExoQ